MTTPEGGTVASPGESTEVDFSPAALRRKYTSRFRPDPRLYYVDMLVSAAIGWTGLGFAILATRFSPAWFAAIVVATFGLYRAALFIHELAHLKKNSVPGFDLAWSLFVGFPILVPSLMYVGSHGEHHRRAVFGTEKDPEYAPIGRWGLLHVIASTVPLLFVPALLVLRWSILGPLSYLIPPLRRFVVGYMSTLVINPTYCRRMPEGRMASRWAFEEAGTALVCWTVFALIATGTIGTGWLFEWYAMAGFLLTLNHVRTLVAHRYVNDGEPMDLLEQYRDSVNLSGGHWYDVLLAPVGLRYHALHHLFPTVPYHSLGAIHRSLLAELPEAAPYRVAEYDSMFSAVRGLFGGRQLIGH